MMKKAEKSKVKMRAIRQYRIDNKLCTRCGESEVTQTRMCQTCRDKVNNYHVCHNSTLKERSLCYRCNQTVDRDGSYCSSCVKMITERTGIWRSGRLRQKIS